MALAQQENSGKPNTAGYEGGLARSLVRTLLIFTFIPLILLAGAAYLRSRSLLREQVVSQMQTQLKDRVSRLDLAVKTKEIRLDRVVRAPTRLVELQSALTGGTETAGFADLQQGLPQDLRSINTETGRTTFSDYFLAGEDG